MSNLVRVRVRVRMRVRGVCLCACVTVCVRARLWLKRLQRACGNHEASKDVLGENPKLSQVALCCLISVCHAEEVTQPLE